MAFYAAMQLNSKEEIATSAFSVMADVCFPMAARNALESV